VVAALEGLDDTSDGGFGRRVPERSRWGGFGGEVGGIVARRERWEEAWEGRAGPDGADCLHLERWGSVSAGDGGVVLHMGSWLRLEFENLTNRKQNLWKRWFLSCSLTKPMIL